jgi:hypothetical protein
MRVRIDPGMALRRRVPFAIVRATNQRELLRQDSEVEGMEWQRSGPLQASLNYLAAPTHKFTP